MNPWSPRAIVNRIRLPSGDQIGRALLPLAWNARAAGALPSSGAHQICPFCAYATRSPFGDTAGDSPSPILRGAPPLTDAIQTASSTPCGLWAGLRLPPRVKTIDAPSGVQQSCEISCPSSAVYDVTMCAAYCGGSATMMFRTPRAFDTHASLPVAEAVRSLGNGAESTC